MRALALVAPVTFAALCFAPRADACTPPLPGFGRAVPADGASVPENFAVFVEGYDFAPFEAYWWDFDVRLEMRSSTLNGLGVAEFDPEQLGAQFPVPMQVEFQHTGGQMVENLYLSYRLAVDVRDEAPPTAPEIIDVDWEYRETAPGLCEPGGYVVQLTFTPSSDDWGVAAYRLLEEAEAFGPRRPVAARLAPAAAMDSIYWPRHVGERTGRFCYSIVAFDVAGNDSPPSPPVCVNVGEMPPLDAGVIDGGAAVDAGPGSPDAGPAASDAGGGLDRGLDGADAGCGCTGARPAEGAAGAVALSFLVLLARRRRR